VSLWVPKSRLAALTSEFASVGTTVEDRRLAGYGVDVRLPDRRQLTDSLALLTRSDTAKTAEILLL
jgi:hypothetical protein